MKYIFALTLVMHLAVGVSAQTEAGSIAGVVLDGSTQQPVPSALVVANRAGAPSFTKNTRSGGDGAFTIEGLTPGNYFICIQPSGDQYVNSCQWNGGSVGIVLSAGETAAGIKIPLTPASLLTVEITDTQNTLNEMRKGGKPPDLSVGVWGPRGLYYPARAVSSPTAAAAGASRTYIYHLAVPQASTVQLHIASRDVKLGDGNGVPLSDNTRRQSLRPAAGDANPLSFKFTVLGKVP